MNIHKLGFTVADLDDLEGYPKFIFTVDGIKEVGSILILPLELSSQLDGVYPILNCGCGEWGCGGYYIKVKNSKDFIIWEAIYGLISETKKFEILHVHTPTVFDRNNYSSVIKELLDLKEKYKWEKNVYKCDKELYEQKGLSSLYSR